MSWRVEVIADQSGKWCGNGCYYPSKEAAQIAASDLAARWFLVREWRVVEDSKRATHDIVNGRLVSLEAL